MSLRPLHDRLTVAKDTAETTRPSGIIIPDTAQERPQTGTVLAAGPKTHDVRPGDRILFAKYAGTDIRHAGAEILVVKEADVLATIAN